MEPHQLRQVLGALEREAVQRGIRFNGLRTVPYVDRGPNGDPTGWIYLGLVTGPLSQPKFVGVAEVPPVHMAMFVGPRGEDLEPSERATVLDPVLPGVYPTYGQFLYPSHGVNVAIDWRGDDAMATEPPWAALVQEFLAKGRPVVAPVG